MIGVPAGSGSLPTAPSALGQQSAALRSRSRKLPPATRRAAMWMALVSAIAVRLEGRIGPVRAGATGLYGRGHRPFEDDPMTPKDESEQGVDFPRWGASAYLRLLYDVPVLGELDAFAEVSYGHNLARRTVQDYPALDGNDVIGTDALAWYVTAFQHLGPYVAIGGRYDEYDAEGRAADRRVGAALLGFPHAGVKLTLAYELAPRDTEISEGWLRGQVKF